MEIQDRNRQLTTEELRRRYNFDAINEINPLKTSVAEQKKALSKMEQIQEGFVDLIDEKIANLEDGKVVAYFLSGEPDLDNEPAVSWEDKEKHLGDLYFDKDTGYAYIFEKEGEVYFWSNKPSEKIRQSLAIANNAQDTADGKRRVFMVEPTPPYDNGDWWLNNQELYVCQIAKAEGSFSPNDFIKATKYTDDTRANQIDGELTIVKGDVTTIINSVDSISTSLETTYDLVNSQGEVISNLGTRMSQSEQTIDGFSIVAEKIEKLTDFLKEAEGTGYLQIDNAPESIGAINRLKITGFDLRELYPDMAYPSNYTFPGVLSFYTLIFSPMPITYVETLPTAGYDNYGKIYNEGGLSGKFWKSGASEDTQHITSSSNLAGKLLHFERPVGKIGNEDKEVLIAQWLMTGGSAYLVYKHSNGEEQILLERSGTPFPVPIYESSSGTAIETYFLESNITDVILFNDDSPGYDLITWGDYAWNEYNDDKIKMVYANSPHPLLNDDELVFENNKIKVVQKNAFNFATNQWESLLQPIEYELGAVELPTYENETYITMKYFDGVDYWAEYIEDNEFTRNYQTQVESKGQINVNSRQLVLKVDSNGHIAETELWADPKTGSRIKLKADDISLEGLTTINDNFKVLLDGSIEANNGKFNGDVIVGNTQLVDKELGLFTTFISSFKANMVMGGAGGRNMIGWSLGFDGAFQDTTSANVFIPDNFIITEAKLFVRGDKTEWHGASSSIGYGVAHNTKLMKSPNIHYNYVVDSGFEFAEANYVNTKALGDNGVSVGGSTATEHLVDIDLSHFKKGMNYFTLVSDTSAPSTPNQAALASTEVVADIQISGYIK